MTHASRWLTVALLGSLLGQSTPIEVWAGAQNARTVAELELMTEEELAGQAMSACGDYQTSRGLDYQQSSTALTQFQTVSHVVRKKKKGTLPQWLIEMSRALNEPGVGSCLPIYTALIDARLKARQPALDALQRKLDKGQITQHEYDQQKSALLQGLGLGY